MYLNTAQLCSSYVNLAEATFVSTVYNENNHN